ncbi:MAG TPA: hypothetical protein VGG85_03405 [Terracidiphilus sp.]|jgi:hypothetical protein
MRILFPKSIPLRPLLIFLVTVLTIQLMQGTDPAFAVLMLAAQLAAVVSFNRLGGMTHMAGAFNLFAVVPIVTMPELAHLFLGQPGDYNLQHPLTTAGVCAVYFICVMVAALVVSSIRHPVPLLDRVHFSILELRIISTLAAIFAALIYIAGFVHTGPMEDGSLLLALTHFFPFLLSISIMLATYVQLTITNGQSAMNWYIACLFIFGSVPGVLFASKEGMLTPAFCWLTVVASARYRFTWLGSLALLGAVLLIWGVLYPFSQNARFPVREAQTLSDKLDVIGSFLSDPSQFPDALSEATESNEFGAGSGKIGIVNRVSLLLASDMLIDADLRAGFTSIDRIAPVLVSVVPHALWPNRPLPISTNELGHKAGILMDETDVETGIALGSPAEFFDAGGWGALILYTLLLFTFFFFVTVRLISTTEMGIWGLVPIGTEALIAGAISPGGIFSLISSFLAMLLVTIAILKVISYAAKTLFSRTVSA